MGKLILCHVPTAQPEASGSLPHSAQNKSLGARTSILVSCCGLPASMHVRQHSLSLNCMCGICCTHAQILVSDASEPGEGEHKIMRLVRSLRARPDYRPNTRHAVFGQDADLLLLRWGARGERAESGASVFLTPQLRWDFSWEGAVVTIPSPLLPPPRQPSVSRAALHSRARAV